jgi:hypothetical protein
MQADKDKFMKDWNVLLDNIGNLTKVVDANRRLLAGITKLLIERSLLKPEDVKKLENDVASVMGQPTLPGTKKKKRRSRGPYNKTEIISK